ncbi:MAG: UbiA family prenyltransferase [Fibrobacterota bacterium]|nr:UbiA family prenyltransferase [Fibrobacterota bacterium]
MPLIQPKSFLALVRIPTVFSSMSNAFAGWFIGGGRSITPALVLGVLAAALFIMAGMALNDVADKDVDARERPDRPIPSGAVSLGMAWGLSLTMMALGLVLLWFANPFSVPVGAALCLCIFGYNFLLKGTFLGPAAMGLCRALNLMTGVSLTFTDVSEILSLPMPVWLAVFSLWAYIALVTFLARDEVGGNSRRRTRLFLAGVALWFIAWSAAAFTWFRAEIFLAVAWLALALFLRRPLRNLASDPSPKHTGQMVGGMLRMVPLVDVLAMLANQVPYEFALAGALWILPAYAVGKWFYST